MTKTYDVVVVGARCAGSPLATMLARRGLSVCVLDKATLPSGTPSTHGIQPNGVHALRRLGVYDDLARLTDPVTRARLAFDDVRHDTDDVEHVTGAPMLNLRRETLDIVLAEAAERAGAEVRTETAVTDVLRADGRVTGVVTGAGEIRAELVVGADGTSSTIARLVGAAEYLRTEQARSFVWGYHRGGSAAAHTVWLGKIGDNAYLASPTDDDLFLAVVAPTRTDGGRFDPETAYAAGLRGWPALADAVASATRVGDLQVMRRGHCYFRESAGPGWVLVGDAGHFKDPTPGQGIADAFRQVERLAPAIELHLGGDRTALRDWWRWRDRDALDMYWFAQLIGAGGSNPRVVLEMLSALLAQPDGEERVIRVLDHTLSPAKVFGTSLLARATVRGIRRYPGRRREVIGEAAELVADAVRQQMAGARTRFRRH